MLYPPFSLAYVATISSNNDTSIRPIGESGSLFYSFLEIEHVCGEIGMEAVT
jgi:hypothetical protein